jgi:luciferase family oxidoreductase group 1
MDVGLLDLGKQYDGVSTTDRITATMQLAREAESAGATRFWLGEHHVRDVAVHAPEVVLALIADTTTHIRVGAGGVLLRYYSPLKVWETYCTLAVAFPNRIDLGLVRGPGVVDADVARQLVWGNEIELEPGSFDEKVRELHRISTRGAGPSGLVPSDPKPVIWLLGSGASSALLASELRLSYGYMCFVPAALESAANTLALLGRPRPRVVLALTVACASSSAMGHTIDEACVRRGYHRANVAGSTDECAQRLLDLIEPFAPDEVAISCLSPRREDQFALIPLIHALTSVTPIERHE